MKSVIEQSLFLVEKVMNCRASSLMLLDRETGELIVSGARGPVDEQVRGERLPQGMGIAGWVAENRKSYYSNNPRANEVFGGDITDRFTTRNIICVPIYESDNETMGVLQAINRPHTGFSNPDVATLEALAENIAISIRRAQQLESARSKLKLQEITSQGFYKNIRNYLESLRSDIDDNPASGGINKPTVEILDVLQTKIKALRDYSDFFSSSTSDSVKLGASLKEMKVLLRSLGGGALEINELSEDLEQRRIAKQEVLCLAILVNELMRKGEATDSRESVIISPEEQNDSTVTLRLNGLIAERDDLQTGIVRGLLEHVSGLKVSEDRSTLLYTMEVRS